MFFIGQFAPVVMLTAALILSAFWRRRVNRRLRQDDGALRSLPLHRSGIGRRR